MAEPFDSLPSDDDSAEPEEVWGTAAAGDPRPSHRRCIVHIDIDCFYAQVEMLERPELRELPLGIQQKNIVVTSNYVARARGVGKCCYVAEALQRCPDLVLVNGSDLTRYRRMSARVHRVLTRFSRRVERLGFDENFLDVTEATVARLATETPANADGHVFGDRRDGCACGCAPRLTTASHVAAEVRRALRDELGISSCAGVGFNKLLAKLACAAHKPDQQTTVFAGGVDALLLGAGAARGLPGVGARMAEMLAELGVRSVEDLRRAPTERLRAALGRGADTARALAFGADEAEVKTSSAALSLGVEDGFKCVDNVGECELKLRELARRVLRLLREDGRPPTVLKVSVRRYHKDNYYRFRESRQSKVPPSLFPKAVSHADDIEVVDRVVAEAMVLLKKMLKNEPFHLTLLGLMVTGFSEPSESAQGGISRFVQKATSVPVKRKKSIDSAEDDDPAPGGVDRAVWASLPSDIQSELLQEQSFGFSKRRKQQSIAKYFDGASSSTCKLESNANVVALDTGPDVPETVCRCPPRRSSASPVEVIEQLDGGDSDLDDPGSPVVSRSAVKHAVDVGSVPWSPAIPTKLAGTSEIAERRDPPDVAAPGTGTSDNPSGRSGPSHSSASKRRAATDPAVELVDLAVPELADSTPPEPDPPAENPASPADPSDSRAVARGPSPPGTRREVGCAGQAPKACGVPAPHPWDQDVFSQLPPDIQFELKMAQRAERRRSCAPSPARSKDRTRTAVAKNGLIMRFFKK
ncbi:DNA polymerase iota-like [Pollicipes pollicipes]|uniref:DNA polymerase iota-like n=1 Tax=Pollicipes pollicipes TaxID=41117 RepID=UPI00188500E8|nr:DNA polymerase iota-like [Pollicipes pollicipes]